MLELNAILSTTLNNESPILDNDELLKRFQRFGGIPRHIYSDKQDDEWGISTQAINSFAASEILSYIMDNNVRPEMYSHRVLCMVPEEETFRLKHLDFVSQDVTDMVMKKISEDNVKKLWVFLKELSEDDSNFTSVLRGKTFEVLCHKHVKEGGFSLHY